MPLSAVAAQPHLFLFFPNCLLRVPSHSTIGSPQRLPSKLSSSLIRHVSLPASASPTAAEGSTYPSSAAAVVGAIRRSSPASPVEFTQRVDRTGKTCLVLYSSDFQGLCMEQLELFRAVVDPHAALSVYVRPAGSYVMDQLELRRVIYYPGTGISQNEECVIVVGNFSVPGGLHIAEIAISKQEVEVVAEFGAIVFPLVKHPFVVGFLVAELPKIKVANCATFEAWEPLGFKEEFDRSYGQSTSERRLRAVMISRSLATAYVMDQKSMLLRQTSWQNNVRMSHLVEQIRSSLSSIKALSEMLSLHVKRSEIAFDIVEDILVQGDSMKDAIQQLQDAVHLTKAKIVQFNEDSLRKLQDSIIDRPEMGRAFLSDSPSKAAPNHSPQDMTFLSVDFGEKDIEVPMSPRLFLQLQEHKIRPCNASDVLRDLAGAAAALASKQQRSLELCELPHSLLAAVEESSLRQALSNLIEGALLRTRVGGKVEIYGLTTPAGGVLIVIDDNGPDMHYMTQMHTLAPFGADLLSSGRVEDNMTWNFVAGLAVAREILESYGCVIRVLSPRKLDAALGTGGTRIELWLPDINFV
ncbi:hypothetical protein KFK09_003917 [Dendrobium nobile]|uniref:Histidine kinase/HSP90-like ATPase domain-containing protein n=1 Tax=Dendrobium nobile TaxID=94219 RepID=A0A8T3C1F5_DENNO|nr:hypothetical protein KFK09_003917 [Dendrobium nobile]